VGPAGRYSTSHMGTSHVGQMGCWLFEDRSATRQCQRTSGSVALLTILMCGQPHGPAFVPPYECDRRFHTGKSGSAASFQRQRWLSHFSSPRQWGQGPGSMSLGCTSYSAYRQTRALAVWFKSDGRNTSRLRQGFGSNVFVVRFYKRTFNENPVPKCSAILRLETIGASMRAELPIRKGGRPAVLQLMRGSASPRCLVVFELRHIFK
jgi:hypothetical protein